MKTYKKNEIKDIFEKETQNITVSKKLKKETLSAVKTHSSPSLYWVKNCAAVLVVSCLCLSLYLHENRNFKEHYINETTPQDISINTEEPENLAIPESILRSAPSNMMKKATPENLTHQKSISDNSSPLFHLPTQEQSINNNLITYDTAIEKNNTDNAFFFSNTVTPENSNNLENSKDSINEIEIGDTEETLLANYPHIEKYENGYCININNQTILYEITNGIISNILTHNE